MVCNLQRATTILPFLIRTYSCGGKLQTGENIVYFEVTEQAIHIVKAILPTGRAGVWTVACPCFDPTIPLHKGT